MLKCTINGKEVEVKEGSTIMEAFYKLNEHIAHYCYHPGLSVAGVCRLCIVDIEGNPRPQIACNTVVTEGMKVTNKSERIKDGAKWVLDFHLINHPLDCPICDQAGECGLQDQYMEFGKYNPEMSEPKVKKHKVVDLGPSVVLDSERCILCSRCTRFTEEVTKTNELGLFNRGDRTEIGCVEGRELDNKYSLNTVDICPVGALTSKDFRFRQRVWYLKDSESICPGCSTGCNIKVYYNKEGMFRVKPVYNEQVNGHWMCDEGRDVYKFVNREHRLLRAKKHASGAWTELAPGRAAKEAAATLKAAGDSLALVLTAQYSVEEYEAIVSTFVNEFKTRKIYFWINNKESFDDFDGLLLRGDKNPNTKGLLRVLEKHGIEATWGELEKGLSSGSIKTLVVAGPENPAVFPDLRQKIETLSAAKNLIWLQAGRNEQLENLPGEVTLIPLKTFVEKSGTFINQAGLEQRFKRATTIVPEALTLTEAALLLSGKDLSIPVAKEVFVETNRRDDQVMLEHRKKNEFVFRRGAL
ncbi:MAG: (2Fe-2S)-binding protein [Bdellovibrionaceae bacterium]|nr:(2Fe-2S)-binding protein [Pseudobdellovibrionaceae bacterium]MBX3032474.1 (2Fe-2S)-binding protein [Pseudobdellovibrionaceae bacterium]